MTGKFLSLFTILDKSAARLREPEGHEDCLKFILAKADGRVPQCLKLVADLSVSKRKTVLSVKFSDHLVA